MSTAMRSKATGQFVRNDSAILDTIGGPELVVTHLTEQHRRPAWMLIHCLRESCGSLEPSGYGQWTLSETLPAHWRTVRDVDPGILALCVRRVERTYPDWRLPRSSANDIYLDLHTFLSGKAL
jgi:hypothetical protein